MQKICTCTVKEKHLIELNGVNVEKLCDNPGIWSGSTGNDNSTQPTVNRVNEGVTTCKTPFTHNEINTAHCVSSLIASAMFAIRFPFQELVVEVFK